MKVIGKVQTGVYLCEVSHREVEKFHNRFYTNGVLSELQVGQEVDLGAGYDFARDIQAGLRATQQLIEKNEPVMRAILNGLRFLPTAPDQTEEHNNEQ